MSDIIGMILLATVGAILQIMLFVAGVAIAGTLGGSAWVPVFFMFCCMVLAIYTLFLLIGELLDRVRGRP